MLGGTHHVAAKPRARPVKKQPVNHAPFALRAAHDRNQTEWFCIVAGRYHGPWPDKGTASAGYATELRRAGFQA